MEEGVLHLVEKGQVNILQTASVPAHRGVFLPRGRGAWVKSKFLLENRANGNKIRVSSSQKKEKLHYLV